MIYQRHVFLSAMFLGTVALSVLIPSRGVGADSDLPCQINEVLVGVEGKYGGSGKLCVPVERHFQITCDGNVIHVTVNYRQEAAKHDPFGLDEYKAATPTCASLGYSGSGKAAVTGEPPVAPGSDIWFDANGKRASANDPNRVTAYHPDVCNATNISEETKRQLLPCQ